MLRGQRSVTEDMSRVSGQKNGLTHGSTGRAFDVGTVRIAYRAIRQFGLEYRELVHVVWFSCFGLVVHWMSGSVVTGAGQSISGEENQR